MISGLPSAAGTTSPGSHPASCSLAGRRRHVALIIREDSGGFAVGGTQDGLALVPGMRDDMVPPPLLRTLYEDRGYGDALRKGIRKSRRGGIRTSEEGA
ncbi:hypothetical protein HEK616_77600 (plasmid) [Streptomyces nigrescens]|uniref:Transposase n=1 Tax=Streptomyces nigrescens TaxID=1920 RepID=A0ABM8A6G6_STRNI|nr:hypothetical protein HEK616_77600 [Streptomyces nigrescens]